LAGSLRKLPGALRKAGLTEEINKLNEVMTRSRNYRDSIKAINAGTADSIDYLTKYTEELRRFQGQLDALLPYENLTVFELADLGFSSEAARQKAISALQEQISKTQELLDSTKEQVKAEEELAEKTAKTAKEEYDKQTAQAETARFREENLKALDEELKRSIRSAEIKNEITAEEANRLRAIIDARKEGQAISNLETSNLKLQNQFLDANLQAYENLLTAAKGYIDGTAQSEKERLSALKASWAVYDERARKEKENEEAQKKADADRKKRIDDLVKEQEAAQKKLDKIFEDAIAQADRIHDAAKEQEFQDRLLEIREGSLVKAAEAEAEYRQQQRQIEHDSLIAEIEEKVAAQKARLEQTKAAELEAAGNSADLKKAIEEKYNADIAELDKNLILTREQLDASFQEQRLLSEKETAKAIEQAYAEMWSKMLTYAQTYLNAATSIANDISTIRKNNIDYETSEKLRANKTAIMSD